MTGEATPQRARVYTVKEAADELGIHPHTIRRWGDTGRIKELRSFGTERQRLYSVDEVQRLKGIQKEIDRLRALTDPQHAGEEETP